MLTISPVESEADLIAACETMSEAALWLRERGMPLWDPEELTPEKMRPTAARAELHLARMDGFPAGTIILIDQDPLFWPEITDTSSLYFHKLAVRRQFAGAGVSKALIGYAMRIAKASAKSHVRLDCSAKHTKLRFFYESHGFRFLDQRQAGPWLVDRLFKAVVDG